MFINFGLGLKFQIWKKQCNKSNTVATDKSNWVMLARWHVGKIRATVVWCLLTSNFLYSII